jgi:TonB family protein
MPVEKPVTQIIPITPESAETPQSMYEDLADSTPRSENIETSEKVTEDLSPPPGNKLEVRVDDVEFSYGWYTNGLKNKINFHWEPADITMLRGNMATVIVGFRIKEDGKVENVSVEKSSGIPIYDNSAIRAVYNSVPFPPFPDGYKGNYLDIHFEFEYHKLKSKR